jgi:hypothetical protein
VPIDAPAAAGAWLLQATATHRTLIERDAAGARLLNESGALAGLRITAPVSWANAFGRIDATASVAHGRLDYDGRTQAGGPLDTASRHTEGEAGLRWRPMQAHAWGEPWLSIDGLWFRRDIAATGAAAGLRETSTMWLAGIGWAAPQVHVAEIPVSLQARWRTSIDHRLHIDYGGLFDESSLAGGRRNEFSVTAAAQVTADWSLSLAWSRARQRTSNVAPIYRGGAAAGTVYQPRIAIDDVGLTLTRKF